MCTELQNAITQNESLNLKNKTETYSNQVQTLFAVFLVVALIILLLERDNVCVLFLTLGGLSASQSGVSAHTERKSQTNFLDWYQSLKAIKKSFVSIKMAAHHTQRKCCLLYFNHSPLSVIMVLLFPPGFPV